MEEERASLGRIVDVPTGCLILVTGAPGAGKSALCCQAVLHSIERRPVIYVTTESGPSKIEESLREVGLGEVLPHPLAFVDAFHGTVGLASTARPDVVDASCQDLTSLGIAIFKLRERVGESALLVFDSLTSPYMFNGADVLRFMRLTLSRFAAEGNAVLACVDEGCGKTEDFVSMMSAADGIVKIELADAARTYDVVKHPSLEPIKIAVPMTKRAAIPYHVDMKALTEHAEMTMGLRSGSPLRTEVGDSVNVFWLNFARWSGMLWDPKRFPATTYHSNKHTESVKMREFIRLLPRRMRIPLMLMPKSFSKVKDMKKLLWPFQRMFAGERNDIVEYVEEKSKTDEHYVRGLEGMLCWGFGNVGATLRLGALGQVAGAMMAFEKEDRDWNVMETKCIGLGDPYCELKFVPGRIEGLKDSLEQIDSTVLEGIHERLMDHLMGFVLYGLPLWNRPRLGSEISLRVFHHIVVVPAIASERYRTAMRLGGAVGGKRVGERLMAADMNEDEAVERVLHVLEHCRVGQITLRPRSGQALGDTIRMVQNCESVFTRSKEPACHFTTGFLNGFFSAVKNQHVRETKCIAMGDRYCEWEMI
jgi:predicted hydrocarbon binding protein/KaiC/GvpD/RAD55 family RecA-like ATPase